MKILAIDTATEACSAALLIETEIIERYQVAPRKQSELILPMVDEIMHESGCLMSQLDAVAFGCGPGSFTGVRLATAVTQGIAFAADIPGIPVSTLKAMAHDSMSRFNVDCVMTAIDARMKEVYWAVYQNAGNSISEQQPEQVIAPQDISYQANSSVIGVGTGWGTYRQILSTVTGSIIQRIEPEVFPRAASIVQLGAEKWLNNESIDAQHALPVYLRNQVTHRSGSK